MKEKLLGFLAALILRLLNATLSWKKEGLVVGDRHWSYGKPKILAFWHEDQLMGPWSYIVPSHPDRLDVSVLISQHSDGRIIASALSFLGIGNIPGSSSRGGVRALVTMKRALDKGETHIVITPDGPRGPAREVKPGVIKLASQTGAEILPIAFAYNRSWKANSWDQMMLPKPFAKARLVGVPTLQIPKDLSNEELEEWGDKLKAALNLAKERAELALQD